MTLPKWTPIPGAIATYAGRTRADTRTVRVVAEALAGRIVVEAIDRKGVNLRLAVMKKRLAEPPPDLFGQSSFTSIRIRRCSPHATV